MGIEIAVRHMEISPEARDQIRKQCEDVLREFRTLEDIHVILDGRSFRKMAELVLQGKPHLRIEAAHTADDVFAAFNGAMDKTLKQLRKALEKLHQHRASGMDGVSETEG